MTVPVVERLGSSVPAKERAKREVLDAAVKVNRTLLATVNQDVLVVHNNQKQIESRTRMLEEQTHRFVQQTSSWIQAHEKLDAALKGLGDVGSWAQGVERELGEVTKLLEFVADAEAGNVGTGAGGGTAGSGGVDRAA